MASDSAYNCGRDPLVFPVRPTTLIPIKCFLVFEKYALRACCRCVRIQVLEGTSEYPRALRASRQAFPFLEILTRWAWRCHVPPEPAAVPSRDTNAPERTGSRGQADRSILRAALEGGTEIAPGGCWSDRGELGTGRVGSRGRGDTGVASLLVAMAKDDPSGETIRSMQRWACQALVPEQVSPCHYLRSFLVILQLRDPCFRL